MKRDVEREIGGWGGTWGAITRQANRKHYLVTAVYTDGI